MLGISANTLHISAASVRCVRKPGRAYRESYLLHECQVRALCLRVRLCLNEDIVDRCTKVNIRPVCISLCAVLRFADKVYCCFCSMVYDAIFFRCTSCGMNFKFHNPRAFLIPCSLLNRYTFSSLFSASILDHGYFASGEYTKAFGIKSAKFI